MASSIVQGPAKGCEIEANPEPRSDPYDKQDQIIHESPITDLQNQPPETTAVSVPNEIDIPHTILTKNMKIFTIIMASFAAFISPVSASAYFPALNSLSSDLHVSVSTINLTITAYMVSKSCLVRIQP
jgi:hypothetical protein